LAWDNQKGDNYPYQTEFSYRINQWSRAKWFTFNIILGVALGLIMAAMLYLMGDLFLSDMARTVVGGLIGIWCTGFIEKISERTTRLSQLIMVIVFALCTVVYSISLL